MFDWLFEGRFAVYLFLAVVGLICFGLWWRDRKRHWLVPMVAVALVLVVYFLLDRIVETRGEQIARKLQEMAAGVDAGDASKIFKHISDRFDFQGSNKSRFRTAVEAILRSRRVTGLAVWDFRFPDDTGKVLFRANPRGNEPGLGVPYLVRAQFVRDGDGEWRLQSFTVHNAFAETDKPLHIPQLP